MYFKSTDVENIGIRHALKLLQIFLIMGFSVLSYPTENLNFNQPFFSGYPRFYKLNEDKLKSKVAS